ncbi:Hsp70 family protein [Pseudanabaena sp. PCC 6802]|uniref:Hsp70 family protein n=1 Tax=Pseudanabaena sp. PCC 6802 TaxID=118173 RepID=UPI000381AF19|nr:Hsp70 family protein [Pseudanabaena sp. PCC 6802]
MTVVAIDFGTSNTVVCTQDPVTKAPRTLRFGNLSRAFAGESGSVYVVPSLVYIRDDGFVLGEQVRSQRLGVSQPQRLFQAFKRDLMAEYRPPSRVIDRKGYDARLVSEIFLKSIWQNVCQHLGESQPECAIITVPVGAFDSYLDWLRDFAEELGVPKVQLVDESTAAALGYAVQIPGSIVLVIDFGGGTLDLSLVRTTPTHNVQKVVKAQVIAKSDAYVGGVDIDTWIVEHYLEQISSSRTEVGEIGWLNLLEVAEKLKIKLSSAQEAKESWFDDENFISHEIKLDRAELSEILEARQLLEQLRSTLDEVLAIAISKGVSKSEIEQVLLVGGSCQIPAVQQAIVSYFGRQRVRLDKPFEAVAHGALVLGQEVTVDDYLRHGYAIRLWEPHTRSYSYFPLFDKGTRYPCHREDLLILQVALDGQKEIGLDIGEVAEISQAEVSYDSKGRMTSSRLQQRSDFRSLIDPRHVIAKQNAQVCIAHLDPPGKIGMDRIEVAFEVNEQRALLATVRDLQTQKILVDRGAIATLE